MYGLANSAIHDPQKIAQCSGGGQCTALGPGPCRTLGHLGVVLIDNGARDLTEDGDRHDVAGW